jgi:hypothetical protein
MSKSGSASVLSDYFCWVRVVDMTVRATPTPVTLYKPRPGEVHIWHWDVPHAQITSASAKAGKPIGVWTVTDGYFGREDAKTSFDLGPAFVDADAATDWIANSPAGRRWDQEALNRFLLKFSTH